MASMIPYLYQLQGTNYQNIAATSFKIGVFDPDSTGLTSSQLASLETSGKKILGYLSIGEAEDYRSYWQDSWSSNPPSWIVDQNADWGSYRVKFWDPAWQKITIDRAVEMAKLGYDGIVMDVVDVYEVDSVARTYNGSSTPREEMMNFVKKIADAARAINPNFKIVQNNALTLLTANPNNPSSGPNSTYLAVIDGVNAESTFYLPDNTAAPWKNWNLQYLDQAVKAGLDVFAMDYPTSTSIQQDFIDQAIAKGFIPFATNQNLSQVPSINYQTYDKLPAGTLDSFLDSEGNTPVPVPETPETPDTDTPLPIGITINGNSSANTLTGTGGNDQINGKGGNDTIRAGTGDDTVHGDGAYDTLYGEDGNDMLYGDAGNDMLYGGNGSDTLYGGTGTDRLEGGAGNDVLRGNDGTDTLIGDAGNDQLYGGTGKDKFLFLKGGGDDVIHDFEGEGWTSGDVIQISAAIYSSKSQIMSHIAYQNGNAIIQLDNDYSVTVLGVAANSLTTNDFQIV